MTNEKRVEELIKKFGFDFHTISKGEIRDLIVQMLRCLKRQSTRSVLMLAV